MSYSTHTVSTDTALHIVANQHRRSVLDHLIESDSNVVALDTLVEHVRPENPPPEPVGVGGAKRMLLELHHTHLPKLEDAGLVEYDDPTKTVHYHQNERIEKLHQFVATELEESTH